MHTTTHAMTVCKDLDGGDEPGIVTEGKGASDGRVNVHLVFYLAKRRGISRQEEA